jgi:hypothetical protein
MDADYDVHEIVKVVQNFRLFDAEGYQRDYFISHGGSLTAGYYIVSWPEAIRLRRFDEYADFYGPFKLRKEAEAFLNKMHKHNFMLIMPPSRRPLIGSNTSLEQAKKVA